MTQGIFWWNAGEIGPAIHDWPTEADSGEGFDFVLQNVEEQDGVAVMEDIVGALDIQGFWVGFTGGGATIVIDLARLAMKGIALVDLKKVTAIAEGLNAISDNAKEWTPEQVTSHAQALRVQLEQAQPDTEQALLVEPTLTCTLTAEDLAVTNSGGGDL